MKRHSRFHSRSPVYERRQSPPTRRGYNDHDRHYEKSMPPRMHRVERDRAYPDLRERRPEYDRPRTKSDDDDDDEGVLYFSDCVMLPPRENKDKPVHPKTPKPEGCRTLYLGGIPEPLVRIPKRLEAILHEVYTTNGGDIDSIRISGRGYCHIRFVKQDSVDKAMSLSGYWMEVKQGYEPAMLFRIVADYSESQLDIEEYESKKLVASRLNLQDSNIPKIPPFSSFELEKLTGQIKDTATYVDAIVILRYWMNTNLNKQTSVRFFNILQASSAQIKRLQSEKQKLDDQHAAIMEEHQKLVSRLDKDFDHLMNLYEDVHKQKFWDNFTKPQRKSIDTWLENVRNSISTNERGAQKSKTALEVAKNMGLSKPKIVEKKMEVTLTTDEKNEKINFLQESLDAMQKQVWEMVAKLHHKELELQAKQSTAIIQDQPAKKKKKEEIEGPSFDSQTVQIMCALTTFLQAHPKGATMEYIGKYLTQECKFTFNRDKLESKLLQMSDVFTKQITIENEKTVQKWKYTFMT